MENLRRGGVSRVGGAGVCGEFGGGGLIFFSGPKFPPSFIICEIFTVIALQD